MRPLAFKSEGSASAGGWRPRAVIVCCGLLLAAGWLLTGEAYSAAATRQVIGSGVNLRSGPSLNHKRVALLAKGTLVSLLAKQGKWAKVQLEDGRQGWIARQYLSLPKVHLWTAIGKGWINANSVNIRSGPSTGESVKGRANKGTPVTILKQMGKWYCVRLNSPLEGWVAGWLLNLEGKGVAAGPRIPNVSVKGDPGGTLPGKGILATAMKYLGRPYRFGGTSPAGFDCSGFVYKVMGELGKRLPRLGRDMLQAGTPVSRENLKPGDVIFFKNTYRRGISHVGIYIGGDKFIHASSAGGAVIITPLSKSYYAKRFCGARRM